MVSVISTRKRRVRQMQNQKVWWHYANLFNIYYFYYSFIRHISIFIHPSAFAEVSLLVSLPTHCQLSYAAPDQQSYAAPAQLSYSEL
jgi:hypothetical protein